MTPEIEQAIRLTARIEYEWLWIERDRSEKTHAENLGKYYDPGFPSNPENPWTPSPLYRWYTNRWGDMKDVAQIEWL